MRVILLNGSPNVNGCTYTILQEVAQELMLHGVEADIIHVGRTTGGCNGCFACRKLGRCVQQDMVNEVADKLEKAQGMVIGAPVYFASPAANMIAFLDRLYAAHGRRLMYKPCGCIVTARRAGTTAALEALNKYPLVNEQPLVPAQYWCMAYGNSPQEILADAEGVEIARSLGCNMAWMVKALRDVPRPEVE